MPETQLILYKEENGKVPLLDWFDQLPNKVVSKCRIRMDHLEKFGYELQRPVADYLREGIYELRISYLGVNYRMLYFFHKNKAVVLSHGLTKENKVPPKEINKAIERKYKFEQDPIQHTFLEKKR